MKDEGVTESQVYSRMNQPQLASRWRKLARSKFICFSHLSSRLLLDSRLRLWFIFFFCGRKLENDEEKQKQMSLF